MTTTSVSSTPPETPAPTPTPATKKTPTKAATPTAAKLIAADEGSSTPAPGSKVVVIEPKKGITVTTQY